ncbi:MAG: substrate-binding domain-containing protein [Anaerovoracaceae bacterium]
MKKTYRLIISLVLGLALVVALAGCGGNGGNADGFDTSSEITVVSREDGSGTRGAFVELMGIEEKDANGNKVDRTTVEAVIANKTDVVMTNVAGNTYAIGYISLGSLNDNVKAVKIDGVEASSENINNGSYPVARPFNIATKGAPSVLAQDFIDYILSAEGQAIVNDGYIAVDDSAASFSGSMPSGKLVVAGSSSVSPVMEKLVEGYLQINSAADIEIQTSDSSAGMTAAIDGTCDIGMASRGLKDSELAELTPVVIAMDGIAVVVNNDNPVDNIASDIATSIFIGETTTWDAL